MKYIDTVRKLIKCIIFLSSIKMKDFFNIRCEIARAEEKRVIQSGMTTSLSQRSTNLWLALSLTLRFQETLRVFPQRALDGLSFESRVITLYFNWWRLKHQPKRLERNIKKIVSVNHYLTSPLVVGLYISDSLDSYSNHCAKSGNQAIKQ